MTKKSTTNPKAKKVDLSLVEKMPLNYVNPEKYQENDIMITFDTTGSMEHCIEAVKSRIIDSIEKMFSTIKNLRVGVIAHGDYCDSERFYVTKIFNLSEDKNAICTFISKISYTYGGDGEECYERVLQELRTKINWRRESNKSVIMYGDNNPHEKGYSYINFKVDFNYKDEIAALVANGIKFTAVDCNKRHDPSITFWKELGDTPNGVFLSLKNPNDSTVSMVASSIATSGDKAAYATYCSEVRSSSYYTSTTEDIFKSLDKKVKIVDGKKVELERLSPDQFHILSVKVTGKVQIADYIKGNGIHFQEGRAFYQLVKPEKIQSFKKILLREKSTGHIFTGDRVREILRLPAETPKDSTSKSETKVNNLEVEKYDIFIQSTSYNRNLVDGTPLIYLK